MCSICNCFAWTLDLFQRILTFFLSCWLACSVCCGLSIAIIAGVAYGYNYCLAEFVVLTRSDVNVYMRRGQFYDKPDLLLNSRRSADNDDAFPSNLTEEYQQEVPPGDDSLARHWEKEQDARKYAEKLTKYSESKNLDADESDKYKQEDDDSPAWEKGQDIPSEKTFVNAAHQVSEEQSNIYHKFTMPPGRKVSILQNPTIPTTIIQSGSSEIVMRKFEPVSNTVIKSSDEVLEDDYDEKSLVVIGKGTDLNTKPPEEIERRTQPDIRLRLEDSPTRKILKMRHWGTSSKPFLLEYSADADEDNLIYKAV